MQDILKVRISIELAPCNLLIFQVMVESQGGSWSVETSSARNHSKFSSASSSLSASNSSKMMKKSKTYSDSMSSKFSSDYSDTGASSYQNGGPVDMNSSEFKSQRDDFFDRVQRDNANRRE